MLQKTVLTLALLSAIASAELKEKGPFIGLDYQMINADSRYETSDIGKTPGSGNAFQFPSFYNSGDSNVLNLKVGYQYYVTRLYIAISQPNEKYDTYSIKSTLYDANFEYIPVFYQNNSFGIRGVFGVAIGLSDNEMYDMSSGVQAQQELLDFTNNSQQRIMYGFQLGVIGELDMGLSLELGFRLRRGNLIEFTDGTNEVTVSTKRQEYYLGVNYLF